MHNIKDFFLNIFAPLAAVNPLIYVLVIAMIPIVELRGAIPIGIAMGLEWWQVYLVAVIGSIIPSPFIVLFFKKFMEFMRRKGWLPKLMSFLDRKFAGKEGAFGTAMFWGVVIFTAIPLPGTGAWTASGIASIIEMPPKKAVAAVSLGCVIAGAIMIAISLLGKTALQAI